MEHLIEIVNLISFLLVARSFHPDLWNISVMLLWYELSENRNLAAGLCTRSSWLESLTRQGSQMMHYITKLWSYKTWYKHFLERDIISSFISIMIFILGCSLPVSHPIGFAAPGCTEHRLFECLCLAGQGQPGRIHGYQFAPKWVGVRCPRNGHIEVRQ